MASNPNSLSETRILEHRRADRSSRQSALQQLVHNISSKRHDYQHQSGNPGSDEGPLHKPLVRLLAAATSHLPDQRSTVEQAIPGPPARHDHEILQSREHGHPCLGPTKSTADDRTSPYELVQYSAGDSPHHSDSGRDSRQRNTAHP